MDSASNKLTGPLSMSCIQSSAVFLEQRKLSKANWRLVHRSYVMVDCWARQGFSIRVDNYVRQRFRIRMNCCATE